MGEQIWVPGSWSDIPVWELRIGDHRVFYDVDSDAQQVIVRAIRRKGRSTTKEILSRSWPFATRSSN